MAGHHLRSATCARLEALGYRWVARDGHDDYFRDESTGHELAMMPWPRWGRRIDVFTLISSFPLANGLSARAFHLDLAAQVSADGTSSAGRWNGAELTWHLESAVVPYLRRARSAADVLDMLVAGDLRPIGSSTAAAVVQHGYHLLKWWQLHDRVTALREIAALVPRSERTELERAPWGRTELAEVLWYGRDLPAPPARPPWGLADQGDPRTERWFHQTAASIRQEIDERDEVQHVGPAAPGFI